MKLNSIEDAGDIGGKRILLRASLNVPLKGGKVANTYRLKQALPTLNYLKKAGTKTVLISHIGRDKTDSLKPVYEALSKEIDIIWGGSILSGDFQILASNLKDGEILMAENLRQDEREKSNDPIFVDLLSRFGEIFVNDAFAVSHREHASTVGVAGKLPSYAGLRMQEEVSELSKAIDPVCPCLFLLGGAKFQTKLPLLEKYLEEYDYVFVGGALANDIFKGKGLDVGQSLVSNVSLEGRSFLASEKLLVPVDVVVEGEQGVETKLPHEVLPKDVIVDCGPATIAMLESYVVASKTVLWNGPFGNYEAGFEESTEAMAKVLGNAKARTIVGGGDTIAAIEKLGLNNKFDFVSTGGGAMLTFLEHGTTPVLEALNQK